MRERSLEELFHRFCVDHDPTALGEVFDRAAPELFRVARYLTRDDDLARDVLQSTFLVAIERADAFDPSRRLEPWLFGILARQASATLREWRRTPNEARLRDATPAPPQPDEIAAQNELKYALDGAIATLPAPYRDLLIARLAGDPFDRARGDASVSTLRQRLHRGIVKLRRLLPPGIASALFLSSATRRTLAQSRDVILRDVSTLPASTVTPIVGGLVMGKAVFVGLVVVVLFSALLWQTSDDRSVARVDPPGMAAGPVELVSVPLPNPLPPGRVEGGSSPRRVDAGTSANDSRPPSYRRALAGITGQIVRADGRPLANVPVALLDCVASDVPTGGLGLPSTAGASHVARDRRFDAARFEADHGETDEAGRFELTGAHPASLHLLSIDPGGEWARIRLIDQDLPSGERTDLGLITLDDPVAWSGRVIDDDGAPVVGARVRVSPYLVSLRAFGAEHFDGASLFATGVDQPVAVVTSLARSLAPLEHHLPLPTARTGKDGRFRIAGVEKGMVSTFVDKEGFVSFASSPTPTGQRGERDIGEIRLFAGETLVGIVVRGDVAVEGATVAVGVWSRSVGILHRLATSGTDGRFVIEHLPDTERIGVVRAGVGEDWVWFDPNRDEVEIDLGATAELTVRVVDEEGSGVDAAEFFVTRRPTGVGSEFLDRIESFERVPTRRDDEGNYRLSRIATGSVKMIVRAPRFAPVAVERELGREETPAVVLTSARSGSVRVVVAGSGAPVEYAKVTVCEAMPPMESLSPQEIVELLAASLARSRTDRDGVATFDLLPDRREGLQVLVQHPAFSIASARWDLAAGRLEVQLDAGGRLLGRLSAGGVPPQSTYRVMLRRVEPPLGYADQQVPRLTVSQPGGEFVARGLAEGVYFYRVYAPRDRAIPATLDLSSWIGGEVVAEDFVAVAGAGETSLDVEIHVAANRNDATLRGVVFIDGMVKPGLRVELAHAHIQRTVTDSSGAFELTGIPPGGSSLAVTDPSDVELEYRLPLQLARAESRELTIELRRVRVDVELFESEGGLAREVGVWVRGIDAPVAGVQKYASTNERGEARIVLPRPGTYSIEGRDRSRGRISRRVEVTSDQRVQLTLDRGVPCAGIVESSTIAVGVASWLTVERVELADETGIERPSHTPLDSTATFEFSGLQPGWHRAILRDHDGATAPIEFELPAGGSRTLRLSFP